MAPTKTDTGHGSLFDIFPERPQAVHGGARFDKGFSLQSKGAPKGASFDEFRPSTEPDNGDHGMLWDEWGWKDMPDIHGGLLYDDGFASPAANTTSNGPLYDLFQPSTQVKFIYEGKDSEGIVDHIDGEDVFVRQRGSANVVPVGLSQFLAFRSPSLDNTAVVAERSDAEAPSAWSPDAHGGGRGAGEPYGQPIAPTPQGQYTEPRAGIPEGSMNILDYLKSLFDPNDVQKEHIGFDAMVKKLEGQGHSNEKAKAIAASIGRKKFGAKGMEAKAQAAKTVRLPSELLKSCSEWSGVTSVAKLRKSRTTATQKLQDMAQERTRSIQNKHIQGIEKYMRANPHSYKDNGTGGCAHCPHPKQFHFNPLKSHQSAMEILKEVTVAESAIQAEEGAAPFSGSRGAGSYCPECRVNVKPSEDGRCPTCQMALKAHEGHKKVPREKGDGNGSAEDSSAPGVSEKTSVLDDLRKAFGASTDPMAGGQTNTLTGKPEQKDPNKGQAKSDPSGPSVPERAHAESDHHENKSEPRMCPHCGEPLKELDEKTNEGAPSNVAPDVAHKCLEGLLDTFKTREEPVSALDSLRELVAA